MIDKTISHYKIIEKIGSGGMGVVYKAEDTKLKRPVALKFLPPAFATDPTTNERFIHEAQAASSLQHINICAIHEIDETDDGQMYIVMDYYEGETLREKIKDHRLTIKEAVDYVIQIAQGLQKAHEKGIFHRDIKPANIIITNDGEAKILDFGLSKLKGQTEITKSGSIPGTVAYMSPEQVWGESVDLRTDIWSLGVVLYEMLVGKIPFNGNVDQALVYSISKKKPKPLSTWRADIPKNLERIVEKSLEKDPQNRYQTMVDLLDDLSRFNQADLPSKSKKTVPSLLKKTKIIWSIALFLFTIAVFIFIFIIKPFSNASRSTTTITPITTLQGIEYQPTFSPDGRQIAFYWKQSDQSTPHIYTKIIGTNEILQLTNSSNGDGQPAWSPDGRYIAFTRSIKGHYHDDIYLISAIGGKERKVYSGALWGGLDWSPDGKTLAFTEIDSNEIRLISLLSLETGKKRRLTSIPIDQQILGDEYPVFSPDGKSLAFVRVIGYQLTDIYIISSAGGEPERLTFDNNFIQGLTWNPNGKEIIFSSNRGGISKLYSIPAKGGSPKIIPASDNVLYPAISSNGQRLVYTQEKLECNIWRFKIPQSPGNTVVPLRVSSSTALDCFADISPDGKNIVFESERSGNYGIWISEYDGTNPRQLTFLKNHSGAPSYSPDGAWVVFDSRPHGNADIFVIAVEGGIPKRLTTESSNDVMPSWSHDGRWIYFCSNRSGARQIWKIPANGGEAVQITKDGGKRAYASTDGKWLYYYYDSPQSSLVKIPTRGGKKSLVLEREMIENFNWTLSENGIYYIHQNAEFRFFNIYTEQEKTMALVNMDGRLDSPKLSPDGQWIYFDCESWQADIMMMENWR